MSRGARAGDSTLIASRSWASERLAGLTVREQGLHRRIVRAIADGATPDADQLTAWADQDGIEAEPTLATLDAHDLVHRDPRSGAIAVAYPFSATPTTHRVHIGDRVEVYAMCALDALGVAFMLGVPTSIASTEPGSGAPVAVTIDPGGPSDWSPREALVVVACAGDGSSADCLCPHTNFATSHTSGQALLDAIPGCSGALLSMPDAIETGRAIFGALLADVPETAGDQAHRA